MQICTAQNPMPPESDPQEWEHPDAIVGSTSSEDEPGYSHKRVCPHCGRLLNLLKLQPV